MKTFSKRIFKHESPADKFITVNKQANLLYKKEQEIYKKTKEFEKNPHSRQDLIIYYMIFRYIVNLLKNIKSNSVWDMIMIFMIY